MDGRRVSRNVPGYTVVGFNPSTSSATSDASSVSQEATAPLAVPTEKPVPTRQTSAPLDVPAVADHRSPALAGAPVEVNPVLLSAIAAKDSPRSPGQLEQEAETSSTSPGRSSSSILPDMSLAAESVTQFPLPAPPALRTAIATGKRDDLAATGRSPMISPRPPVKASAAGDPAVKPKTTKAERRALQEAQRAAKQSGKGGSTKDTGGQSLTSAASLGKGGGARDSKGAGGTLTVAVSSGKGCAKDSKSAGESKSAGGTPRKGSVIEKKGGVMGDAKEKQGEGGGGKEREREGKGVDKKKEPPPPVRMQFDDGKKVEKAYGKSVAEVVSKNRVELFRHLPQFEHRAVLASTEAKFAREDLHPAVYKIGLKYLSGEITGANARCVAMLLAFRQLIQDYSGSPERVFARDLTSRINANVGFLITCRPLATSMGNAIKFLKTCIAEMSKPQENQRTEEEAKSAFIAQIDRFIQEKIVLAGQEIVRYALGKIRDGDVLLTYACSHVVEQILKEAHKHNKKFRVIVVDSRPKLEGQELLSRLLRAGIHCSYVHINALCYAMREATRVLLGASSVLANGTVVSRVGSAAVGMVAHQFHVPVLVCCESYKFHERVQLDSICSNELGDPTVLVAVEGRPGLPRPLEGWESVERLQLLNLTYDAMPAEYVDMIVTELGMVPPTSVPVILREYRKELVI